MTKVDDCAPELPPAEMSSTGRGAMRGLLLGSVALHCVMHAPCPVMVVHPHPAHAPDEPARSQSVLAVG